MPQDKLKMRFDVLTNALGNDTIIPGPYSCEISYNEKIEPENPSKNKDIPTKDLYPLREEHSPVLTSAFRLLEEGSKQIEEAIKMDRDGDRIGSDNALMSFHALLPELFCCRSLSDGFGAIVNAMFHGINNFDGNPLNGQQLQALLNTLGRIQTEPFLEFNEAVEQIMTMEDVGFIVEPREFEYLSELLNEESIY